MGGGCPRVWKSKWCSIRSGLKSIEKSETDEMLLRRKLLRARRRVSISTSAPSAASASPCRDMLCQPSAPACSAGLLVLEERSESLRHATRAACWQTRDRIRKPARCKAKHRAKNRAKATGISVAGLIDLRVQRPQQSIQFSTVVGRDKDAAGCTT